MLLHLPDNHGALAVQEAITAKMSELPDILRQTLTWDQGSEMANHVQIAAATDLDIYFCDPHSPWQRGTNENTNGLLRQYFPKGTDLSFHGAGYLDYVAAELNNRPRKRLNWRTPAEALDRLLSSRSTRPVLRCRLIPPIQTASKVLKGEFTAREAITILVTLTREAESAARELRDIDPDRADVYREPILVIGRELQVAPTSAVMLVISVL